MTNKTKIIGFSAVAVLLLGAFGSTFAYDQTCTTPEAQMLRDAAQNANKQDPALQAKLKGLPILEREEARICALRKLLPEEKAAIVAKKQAMAGFTPAPDADPLPPVVLGVRDAISPTYLKQQGLIPGINSWAGYVDGKFMVVTGTAETTDPSQGILFVMNGFNPTGSQVISAPIATGPLKIVSEANGTLTVQSVAGTYEVYDANTDTRRDVTTKGGTTYTFNLKSRTFK
ncbi:MAG TPA: hypothetical protein VFM02_01785 [Candidatus Paceibacterota bacterium]|nr:hypothetical protein [Candidatus Paceibacterota bacterium]